MPEREKRLWDCKLGPGDCCDESRSSGGGDTPILFEVEADSQEDAHLVGQSLADGLKPDHWS